MLNCSTFPRGASHHSVKKANCFPLDDNCYETHLEIVIFGPL